MLWRWHCEQDGATKPLPARFAARSKYSLLLPCHRSPPLVTGSGVTKCEGLGTEGVTPDFADLPPSVPCLHVCGPSVQSVCNTLGPALPRAARFAAGLALQPQVRAAATREAAGHQRQPMFLGASQAADACSVTAKQLVEPGSDPLWPSPGALGPRLPTAALIQSDSQRPGCPRRSQWARAERAALAARGGKGLQPRGKKLLPEGKVGVLARPRSVGS